MISVRQGTPLFCDVIFARMCGTDLRFLVAVNDAFILYLLDIIEGASDDADDPYHYPVIRVLVSR
jgi:hypothetical protein